MITLLLHVLRLVVNLKAARALRVRVPKAVLSRADQIID